MADKKRRRHKAWRILHSPFNTRFLLKYVERNNRNFRSRIRHKGTCQCGLWGVRHRQDLRVRGDSIHRRVSRRPDGVRDKSGKRHISALCARHSPYTRQAQLQLEICHSSATWSNNRGIVGGIGLPSDSLASKIRPTVFPYLKYWTLQKVGAGKIFPTAIFFHTQLVEK